MDEPTALSLFRQAVAAGMDAQIIARPPEATDLTGTTQYQVRVTARTGSLGPAVLRAAVGANVALASSDALLQ